MVHEMLNIIFITVFNIAIMAANLNKLQAVASVG